MPLFAEWAGLRLRVIFPVRTRRCLTGEPKREERKDSIYRQPERSAGDPNKVIQYWVLIDNITNIHINFFITGVSMDWISWRSFKGYRTVFASFSPLFSFLNSSKAMLVLSRTCPRDKYTSCTRVHKALVPVCFRERATREAAYIMVTRVMLVQSISGSRKCQLLDLFNILYQKRDAWSF